MGARFQATLTLLGTTDNEGAVELLIAALESPCQETRQGAVRTLVHRANVAGHAAVIQRLHLLGDDWQSMLAECGGHMTQALRDLVLSRDRQSCVNACQALLFLREYDLIAALVAVMEEEGHPNIDLAAKTLLELVELLYQELAAPRDYRNRRDPQLVRRHVTASLEQAISRFGFHQRREAIEAFMLLTPRDNSTLKQILLDPLHSSYLGVIDVLTHSERGGVLRLLLSYLDDPHAPTSAITALARRCDTRFVRHLLKKIGFEPSAHAAHNLKRVETVPWLQPRQGVLETLDDAAQYSAVKLLMATAVRRLEAFQTIEYLALHGTPGGRRAAYESLTEFNGAEANALALRGLNDSDPLVQAAVAGQLRQRGVPGAMARLIELLDSRHQVVRDAVRECLAEFQFKRFVSTFDLLDPDVRQSTGALVRKVDPEAISQLSDEMRSPARSRRLRSIEMALAMNAVPDLEIPLIELLHDEDHMVRNDAARVLAACESPLASEALEAALLDRSSLVQETARRSLDEIAARQPGMPQLPTWPGASEPVYG